LCGSLSAQTVYIEDRALSRSGRSKKNESLKEAE